jgi:hypothetical protein
VLPSKPFNTITIFILPGITLPPDTAAAVYISLPSQSGAGAGQEGFKFLGGIGDGKESAVFKVSGLLSGGGSGGSGGEVDMDASDQAFPSSSQVKSITLGISLETAASVSSQMAALQASQSSTSTSLVLTRNNNTPNKPDPLVLAQRIIKNAFNFLASFSGNVNGGVEVVPLKAFEEWWKKFEGRVRSDPGFLERATEGD